jgi:hypothetical protein
MISVIQLFISTLFLVVSAQAQSPPCNAAGQLLPVNNEQVLQWKSSTANQFHSRAHIHGKLAGSLPDHSGHHHLSVQIGPNSGDTVEVIYNEAFGPVPSYSNGSDIEACGDYITSNASAGPYPASPDGAIIHWVHEAPNSGHESGFVIIDGTVCGQNPGGAPPKPPRHH